MKRLYYFLVGISLLAIGFSGVATSINAHLSLVSYENPSPKKAEKPQPKKHKEVKNTSKITHFSLLTGETTTTDALVLVPTITATKTVAVQGGGNPVPGSQLNYTIVVNNAGTDATAVSVNDVLVSDLTLVAGSVKATPIAVENAYTSLGNVGITVNAANGLLTNDISPDATALTITAVTNAATTDGGKITIATDGSFDYTPKTGTGASTDTYIYTLNSSNGTSSTTTVTFTISSTVWFVNNAAVASGDGSLASPFKQWSDFGTANTGAAPAPQNNHTIFVYTGTGDYTGAVTLRTGQKVIGQGATATLVSAAGITLPTYSKTLPTTGGTNPNLTSSGTTITLGSGNTLGGFAMGNSTKDIVGSSFGTLTVNEVALTGNGAALELATGNLAATFTSISSTNSASSAISFSSITGNLTVSGGTTITNPTSSGIIMFSSSTVTSNFGNTSVTGSSGPAILLISLNPTNTTFGSLDLTPDANQNAIQSTNNGTITCTSGTFSNTGIHCVMLKGNNSSLKLTLNMVLTSISSNGHSLGILLENTLGSFTVTGTGTTAGSGGTIQNKTLAGAKFDNATNITLKNMNFTNANTTVAASSAIDYSLANGAITLNNVSGVTLTKIAISGTTRERGITGKTISNFTLNGGSTITDCGDEVNEGCLYLQELTGTCTINDATLSKGSENLARVFNSTGALTLNIGTDATTTTFNDTQTGNANAIAPDSPGAISSLRSYCFIYTTSGSSTGTATLNVRNTSFLKAGTHGFKVISDGSGTVNANIKSCTFNNDNATFSPNDQGGSIEMTSFATANLNYNILNNTCRGKDIHLINIVAQVNSIAQGRVNDNTVTHSGTVSAGDGIRFSAEQSSDITTEVLRNTVSGMAAGVGISATSILGDGKINATITNNTVTITDPLASHNIAIVAGNTGTTFSNYTCANVANNTTTRPDLLNGFNFRVRAVTSGGTHKVYLQGTGATSAADVWANNTNTPSAAGNVAQGGTFGTHIFSSTNGGALATCAVVSNPTYNSIVITSPVAESIDKVAEEMPLTDGIKTEETEEAAPQDTEETPQETEAQLSTESTNSNAKIAAPLSGETITVNGTGSGFSLPASKSTTITFSATVSSTPSTCAITNQASVTFTGGGSPVNSNTTTTNLIVPPPTGVTGATSICSGLPISLSATCPSGTIQWYTTAAPSTLLGTGSPFSQSPSVNTTYTAKCKVGGCESVGTNSGLITVNALPVPSPGTNSPICAGATLNLTSATSTSYVWAGPNSFSSTLQNPNISNATIVASGTYTVRQTNSFGCTALATVSATVNALPNATASTSTPSICVGGTINLTSSGGGSYLWNGPSTFTSSQQNPSITNATTGATGTYVVTVTNNGCTATAQTTVTVNTNPTASPSSNSPVCAGSTLNLTSSSASAYLWTGQNSFTSSQQNPSINAVTSAAAGAYTLTVTNASGCTGTATIAVVINSTQVPTAPTATPSSRTTTGSVTLSATGCVGGTLTWYDASTNVAVLSPNNQPNLTSSGTFNFYAKCTGANTCVSDASVNVPVTVTLCTPLVSSPGNVNITWTGLINTDWNTACNWSPAWVPDATNGDVNIPNTTNQPTIFGGTAAVAKNIEVRPGATLTIAATGSLTMNGSKVATGAGCGGCTTAFLNYGTVQNNGQITLGNSSSPGNSAMFNKGTGIFNNNTGGKINIDNSTDRAILNFDAIFNNSGLITIGSLASVGVRGLNNIGATAMFNNNTGGEINIDNATVIGFYNESGTVTNAGKITIGAVVLGAVNGLQNEDIFNNNVCGQIIVVRGTMLNSAAKTFTNAGLVNVSNTLTNSGTFTNNGVVKVNTVPSITNNKMVITNACPIFTLGGTNNYTVSGIFTDAAATTSAGTYTSVGNKFTANNTIPTGTQALYAQVSDGTCTFVVPFDFNNVLPTAVSVNNTTICTGGSVMLSGTCASGTLTWYTDETGGTSIGTGTSLSQSPTSTTTYYAACETTNCVSGRVATSEVTVSNLPNATASNNSPICAGTTLNLNSGSEGNTYVWTGPNSFTSTELSPSIANATVLATGTYTITVTNASSCTATATTAVIVNAIPAATASSNSPVCIGNPISLTGGGVGTYQWSGPNGFSSTAQSPTIASATALATGTYTITVTGVGSCTSTATTAVTVNGLATASVTPSTQTICSGGAITTIAITGNGTSYTWTRDNTTSATGIAASGSGDISGSLTNTANTPLTVTFTITPVSICNGTPITATVIVNPIPTATASIPSQSICSGTAISGVTLTNLTGENTSNGSENDIVKLKDNPKESGGITFGPSVAGTVFNWVRDNTATVIGIAASGSGNITGSLTNTTASPITVTFTVTPSYTNAGTTCTGTPITVTVTVNPNPASATITDAGTAFCSGSSTTLSAPADPNYTYAWERSLTGIANPNSFTTFGGTAQTQVITTSGVYRAVVTNQYNCSARDTTAVKFGDLVFGGSLGAGDAQQTGRMNRFAVVSTCAAPTSYPGTFTTTGLRFYDSYTVTNPTNAPICATIGLTSGCGTTLFSAAYLGSFNPASVSTNYLADHGSSFPATAFYEATIPANGTIVVVVHEVNVGTGCSNYNLRIDVPGATVAPTASSNTPICAGNTLNLTGTGTGTYAWTGPNGFSSSAQNPSIANATTLATGTYTINVTNTNGCVFNATTAVTVNANPTATASSNSPICAGNTLNLTGGGVGTYAWSGPNGYTSTAQSPTIASATVLASGVYRITVTNANSCTSTATTSVTVNPLPVVDAGANQTICEGSTASLTATCNFLTFNTTLSGTSEVPANASTATGNVSGTYDKVSKQLLLTFTFNGLAANASAAHLHKAAVGVNGPVQIGFPGVPSATSGSFTYTGTLTSPQEVDLLAGLYYANIHNASFPGGELRGQLSTTCVADNFIWNPGSLSGQTVTVSPNATQLYTVTASNTTTGCSTTATTVVNVNPRPVVTIGSNTPLCAGNTLNLTTTVGSSDMPSTFAWAGPNSFTSTAQSPTIISSTVSASGTYTVTVTNVSGCITTATTAVVINANPTATASSNSPICAETTLNLIGGGVGTYAWTSSNGFTSTAQSPTISNATVSASGTYTITVTNVNGCTSTASVAVTVNPTPTATASSNAPICAGGTLNLTGGGVGTYSWTSSNGFTSTAQNPTISNATVSATGTYTITVTDVSGCTSTASVAVTVNALPTATATNNSPICSGVTLNLTGGGVGTYAWAGPSGYSSTDQSPSIPSATASMSGTYTITVTNANGCTSTATTSVTVNPVVTTPTPQANTQIIFGASITLTATGCSGVNDVLKWYQSADNALAVMPVSPTATTNYYAKCETTLNGITCISGNSTDVTVTVLQPNPPVATGATNCLGTPTTLTATGCTGSVGTFVLKWYQNADDVLVTMPVSPLVSTDYYAKCEQTFNAVTAISAKSNVVTLTILNPPTPVSTGGTIYNGQSISLTATGCTGTLGTFTLKWYQTSDNALVTMPVSPTVTTQYYAKCEQTANSVTCLSAKSNDVTVTVVNRIFVDITKVAAPIQNGNSWATAYGNLQTGLAAATAGVEVWVAKGTYKPTNTTTRTIYFNIPNNVIVYGGFAGTEDHLIDRNFRTNISILSGDIGTDKLASDNSYHVVVMNGSSNTTVLDGFTISDGYANFDPNRVYLAPNAIVPSTGTIETGGGILVQNAGSPTIANCIISQNAAVMGGGIYAGDASTPNILFCKIIGNQAGFGSGMYFQDGSHGKVSNTLIAGNRGIGGVYNNTSNPMFTNVTFGGNGGYNGGIFNSNSQPVVKNSIIWGNSTPFNDTQSIITYSTIQGGYAGVGNLSMDPKYVSPMPDGLSPIITGDYHVQASSLTIDRGDNGTISLTDKDLDGNLRRFAGGRVDMGAYEFQGTAIATLVISVATGNWESNSTWDVGRVPQLGDYVIIDNSHIVTLTGTGIAKNLEYRGTGQLKFNATTSKLEIGF